MLLIALMRFATVFSHKEDIISWNTILKAPCPTVLTCTLEWLSTFLINRLKEINNRIEWGVSTLSTNSFLPLFSSHLKLTPHFALKGHIHVVHTIVHREWKKAILQHAQDENALDWVNLNGAQPSANLGLRAINICGGVAAAWKWRDDNKIPLESWCAQIYATWLLSLLDKKPMYTLSAHKLAFGSPKALARSVITTMRNNVLYICMC